MEPLASLAAQPWRLPWRRVWNESLLAGLIRAGLLRLDVLSAHTFPLEEVNLAIQYAHDHGSAFHLTVLTP